jgi:lauroyl/myristoyl acyltransferase
MEARAALRQGHVVYLLADGGAPPRWTEGDFLGVKQPLRVGFAQLALITGAPVIVNHVVAQPGGAYRVEFAGPLDPGTGAQTEEQRIQQLAQAFAGYLAHWWEESDWLIYSHSAMAEYLKLPARDRKDVGITRA